MMSFRLIFLFFSLISPWVLGSLNINNNITKIVVVLTPPAVEVGDPPININSIVVNLLMLVSEDWSSAAIPAVLVVILWKNALENMSTAENIAKKRDKKVEDIV